jgi:GNAT superfamily N-acetyltransferase
MEREYRLPVFGGAALAERVERVEAQGMAAASAAAGRRTGGNGEFAFAVAGGFACYAGPGSPLNKVAGLGFGGVPTDADIERVEQAYAGVGSAVQVELASLADPQIAAELTGRGYRLVSFENVLGRDLTGLSDGEETGMPDGVEVSISPEEELELWLDLVVDGVIHPDEQGVPSHDVFDRQTVADAERDLLATGVRRYLARLDGIPAGGAGLRMVDGVAEFAGAATVPAHRRRGVQSALLSARLRDAAAAGCDIAVITTQPGSKSQQNAQRRGFDLLYTRAVLVRS